MEWEIEIMTSKIRATSVVIGSGDDSSVDMSARAIKECLDTAGTNGRDIGILINIGIHRDKNIVEPAIASLIQKQANMNLNPTGKQVVNKKGTFSFDLIGGSCGFIHAVQVIDTFFKNKVTEKAIIVSSDIHPSGKKRPDFPFTPSSAAMLLEKTAEERGFQDFFFNTSEETWPGIEQYCNIHECGNHCRDSITVKIDENYSRKLIDFTVGVIKGSLSKGSLDLSKVKYIITSTPSKEFGKEIVVSLGFQAKNLIDIYELYGDTNTSSLIMGYHFASKKGDLQPNDQILFISGSGGLSLAYAIYAI